MNEPSGHAGTAAALLVWHDHPPEVRGELYRWYQQEHHPRRLALPGWHSVRRFAPRSGAPAVFSHYRVRDLDVLTAPAYLAQLRAPTAWSRRMLPHFQNMSRTACARLFEQGHGEGGVIGTWRLTALPGVEPELVDALQSHVLPELLGQPGLVRVALLRGDREASLVSSREREMRRGPGLLADLVILVGAGDEDVLRRTRAGRLGDNALLAMGAAPGIAYGDYRFVFGLRAGSASDGQRGA